MRMYGLITKRGTAAAETGICQKCKVSSVNRKSVRAAALHDVNPASCFIDCTENDAMSCQICGAEGVIQYLKGA